MPGPTAAFAQPGASQSYQLVHSWPQWPAVAGVGALLVGDVSSSQAASSEGTRSALRTGSGQRKGKAERRRAMQSSQSQTCHAMKATQTDLDGPRLDKVLTQNAAYLNYIHQVTRWMPYFLVAVLFIIFIWPLLMLCTGHLLFSQALESHKKEILDWKGKHDQCEGKLKSINQLALACESRLRKTLQEQDMLNRTLAGAMKKADKLSSKLQIAQVELGQCKSELQTGKAEYLHSIQDLASQLETCQHDFTKTWGDKELLNRSLDDALAAQIKLIGSLQEVQSKRGHLQDALQTCEAEVKEQHEASMECSTSLAGLEDEIEIAWRGDIKLSSRLEDAILLQDVLKARHGSCLRELAKRADETDKKVKQWRDMRSQDLKTLHHGLHWMWKFENLGKQNNQLMEAVQALEEQVKELEASPAKTAFLTLLALFSSSKSQHSAKSE